MLGVYMPWLVIKKTGLRYGVVHGAGNDLGFTGSGLRIDLPKHANPVAGHVLPGRNKATQRVVGWPGTSWSSGFWRSGRPCGTTA